MCAQKKAQLVFWGGRTSSTAKPTLTPTATPTYITSVCGLGIERYLTYQSFALTDRVSARVNLCNGNLITQYNAWTHTYAASLAEQTNDDVIYSDSDGTQHLFVSQGNGNYDAPAGIFDTLVKHGDGTFTLTHPDQSAHEFDARGKLTALRDRHNNTITLTYTGNDLTEARAAGGQTLTFAYADGKLQSVTDNANHAIQLTWNNGGRITHISAPITFVTQFAYSSGRSHPVCV